MERKRGQFRNNVLKLFITLCVSSLNDMINQTSVSTAFNVYLLLLFLVNTVFCDITI